MARILFGDNASVNMVHELVMCTAMKNCKQFAEFFSKYLYLMIHCIKLDYKLHNVNCLPD